MSVTNTSNKQDYSCGPSNKLINMHGVHNKHSKNSPNCVENTYFER